MDDNILNFTSKNRTLIIFDAQTHWYMCASLNQWVYCPGFNLARVKSPSQVASHLWLPCLLVQIDIYFTIIIFFLDIFQPCLKINYLTCAKHLLNMILLVGLNFRSLQLPFLWRFLYGVLASQNLRVLTWRAYQLLSQPAGGNGYIFYDSQFTLFLIKYHSATSHTFQIWPVNYSPMNSWKKIGDQLVNFESRVISHRNHDRTLKWYTLRLFYSISLIICMYKIEKKSDAPETWNISFLGSSHSNRQKK